ncbi:MAG: MmgE/PrpD family protein [Bryobacteraceae bacterium]|jgi:2-methylcitrate dehydratase
MIQAATQASGPCNDQGIQHAIQLAISAATGAGKLFGLSAGQIANAIAIATVDNISLTCVHVKPGIGLCTRLSPNRRADAL